MNKKNYLSLIIIILLLGGCATYEFQRGRPPYDKGYVVSRSNYTIVEYTIGKDNSVPDLNLARKRFKRRKGTVEYYYKRMGLIEERLKEEAWDRGIAILGLIGSVFTMPGRIISAYKYENNPKYKEKIDRLEAEKNAREEARVNKLKEGLHNYIQQDLSKEKPKD